MKQITSILRIAALVVVGALTFSCTELNKIPGQAGNDEGAGNNAGIGNNGGAGNGEVVTLTISVKLDTTPDTRALDASGHKTFSANDQIALLYKKSGSDEIVKAVSEMISDSDISSDGRKASFTVSTDSPNTAGPVRIIYPAAMAKNSFTDTEINDDNTIDYSSLNAQDGTLASLAAGLDLCTYDGTFSDLQLDDRDQLPSLTNRLAIVELTAKNYGGTTNLDALTSLTVSDGTNSYAITPKSPATTLSWPVYVAAKPVTSDKTITISAESSTYPYTKTVTSRALTQGNLYPVIVKMHRIIDLSQLTANFEAQHGDILQGTLGSPVKISIADGAEVTLDGMAINGVNNTACKWAGLTCIGDATIVIADGTTNTVTGFDYYYPGIFIPAGKTLTIQGSGELKVSAQNDNESHSYHSSGASAIGASSSSDAGNIEIQGGKITAISGFQSAGIGGSENHSCGFIKITGGEITAKSDGKAAGIGGGENSTTGAITISGGIVKAYGHKGGAGIGSGGDSNGAHPTNCGNILINGTAIVEAYGGEQAAAIGSGWLASCGSITISGSADVTAEAKSTNGAAGIGSGLGSAYGDRTCGDIVISTSGTVVATGGLDGAGIGSGGSSNTINGKCGNITISAGTITATGSNNAAGIGLAAGGRACGNITITDGVNSVTATKGNSNNQNCIGFGNEAHLQGDSISLGTITIDNKAIVFNKFSKPSYKPEDYSFEHFNSSLSTDGRTWTLTHK